MFPCRARSQIWWSLQLRILPDFSHQDETDGSILQLERSLNVYLAWTELISGKRCSNTCQVTFFAPKNWIAHAQALRPARAQPGAQPRCWHQLDSAQCNSSRKSLKEFIPILSQFYQDKKQFREFVPCGAAIQPCSASPLLLFWVLLLSNPNFHTGIGTGKCWGSICWKLGEVTTLCRENHLGKGWEKSSSAITNLLLEYIFRN